MILDWKVAHDPLKLLTQQKEYTECELDAKEQGEDVLQIENRKNGMVLDLGWYENEFAVYLIDKDWEKPLINERYLGLSQAIERFVQIAESSDYV